MGFFRAEASLCRGVDRNYANQVFINAFLYGKTGELTSVAGASYAAKGQFRRGPGRVIYEGPSGQNARGHSLASFYIRGKCGASQTEFRMVSECNGSQ